MSEVRIAILDAVSKEWDKLDIEMTGGVRGEAIPTLMALRQHRYGLRGIGQAGSG